MMKSMHWSQEDIEFFQAIPPFSELTEPLQQLAWKSLLKEHYSPGEQIVEQTSTDEPSLYIVRSGSVRLMDVVLHRNRTNGPPGIIFGVQMVRDNDPAPFDVWSAQPTVLARLPQSDFVKLCEMDEGFLEAFAGELAPLPTLPDANGWVGGVANSPFAFIQSFHGAQPYGTVLDAGTGESSLRWILGLHSDKWTAVTGDERWKTSLYTAFGDQIREQDTVLVDNWLNPDLLSGQVYDTVLADYLLGAIERFAPYYQDQIWERLRPHVGKRLYVIGLEPPHLQDPQTVGGQLIQRITILRDSCMQLAGETPFREYPLSWVKRNLERAGFIVEATQSFQNRLGALYVDNQLDECLRLIPKIRGEALQRGIADHIFALREEAFSISETFWGINFGVDYAIAARPA